VSAPRQIAPGIRHWTARHPRIGIEVSSYWLPEEGVLIDALLPDGGPDAFADRPPRHVLMTIGHHDRHAWEIAERFGAAVHCPREGLWRIEGRGEADPFGDGDELPGGIVAHQVGALCPDEYSLHVPARGALACADGVVKWPGSDALGFVPDNLMDEPEKTKAGLRAAYRRLAEELEFEALLLAHGDPVFPGGREALRGFAAG
jgi:hypothetical protein